MIVAQASNTVSDPVLIATIGVVSALIAGFFKVISNQTKANEKLTEAIKVLAENSDKNARSIMEQTRELRKGNVEAAERNGHLGEQNEKIAELIIQSKDDIKRYAKKNHEAIKNIKVQKVEKQEVHNQNVEG